MWNKKPTLLTIAGASVLPISRHRQRPVDQAPAPVRIFWGLTSFEPTLLATTVGE